MPGAMPLIYSGQEEPVQRALEFFDKDPIAFGKYERAKFYQTLLALRKRNQALAADAAFRKVQCRQRPGGVCVCARKGRAKVLVSLNLSATARQ